LNILNSLPLITLISFTIILKRLNSSWLSPPVFFSSLWSFFIFIPLIFAPKYPINSFGLWIITLFVYAVGLGSFIGDNFSKNEIIFNTRKLNDTIFKPLFFIIVIMIALSLIGLILLFYFGLSRFNLSNSLLDLLLLPNQFSMDRYTDVVVMPISIRLLMYFLFPASLSAGIVFRFVEKRWKKMILLLPIFLSIGYAFILTTRSTIILSLVLWYSGFFAAKILKQDESANFFKIQTLFLALFFSVSFIGIFILTAWLREAGGEFIFSSMIENIRAYFFGYLSSFTQWAQNYNYENLSMGLITFAGPADLMGLTDRGLGFYNEISILGESHTNIFTALRGIIHDYSIFGGFIFFLLFGLLSTLAYKKCIQNKILWIIPLSIFYSFTIYSPLISIFNYNSIIAAWVILAISILFMPVISRILK
jgi:oligosaccharide repeat unit polymerase